MRADDRAKSGPARCPDGWVTVAANLAAGGTIYPPYRKGGLQKHQAF
jgi:hypothetical protein